MRAARAQMRMRVVGVGPAPAVVAQQAFAVTRRKRILPVAVQGVDGAVRMLGAAGRARFGAQRVGDAQGAPQDVDEPGGVVPGRGLLESGGEVGGGGQRGLEFAQLCVTHALERRCPH